MRINETRPRLVLASVVVTLVLPVLALAQAEWSADFGIERSDVTIDDRDDVWGVERVQLLYRDPSKGGVFFSAARHTRFDVVDPVFRLGGYRRAGEWTFYGELGWTPGADFYFRQSVDVEISRRTVRSLVAHVRYRFLNFPTARVHVVSPAATYYFARGELHARVYLVRNDALGVDSQSGLVRGHWQAVRRVRVGGGLALGERIFDITSLPGEPAEGWVVYGETLVTVHEGGGLGVVLGFAHEEPSFDRTNFGVFYRRWF